MEPLDPVTEHERHLADVEVHDAAMAYVAVEQDGRSVYVKQEGCDTSPWARLLNAAESRQRLYFPERFALAAHPAASSSRTGEPAGLAVDARIYEPGAPLLAAHPADDDAEPARLKAEWAIMARACGNWRDWPGQAETDHDHPDWKAAARAILERDELKAKLGKV